MDVISLHQADLQMPWHPFGTALTSGHASLIKRYVNEVYLTYDSDEAGKRKAALRAVPILEELNTAKDIRWIRIKIQMNLLKIWVQKPLKNPDPKRKEWIYVQS